MTIPEPLGKDNSIKFIYHPEKNTPINIYFNSKSSQTVIYTKLIKQ